MALKGVSKVLQELAECVLEKVLIHMKSAGFHKLLFVQFQGLWKLQCRTNVKPEFVADPWTSSPCREPTLKAEICS